MLQAWIQGSDRKGKAAEERLKKGLDLDPALSLYDYPGTDPVKMGSWLKAFIKIMTVQLKTIPDVLQPDVKAARDHFANVVFNTPVFYAGAKANFEANEESMSFAGGSILKDSRNLG